MVWTFRCMYNNPVLTISYGTREFRERIKTLNIAYVVTLFKTLCKYGPIFTVGIFTTESMSIVDPNRVFKKQNSGYRRHNLNMSSVKSLHYSSKEKPHNRLDIVNDLVYKYVSTKA